MSGQEKGSTQCEQTRKKPGRGGERKREREREREREEIWKKVEEKKERHTTFKQKQKECVT